MYRSDWGGLWTPCAGSVTPWNTHIGSEEYEPDGKHPKAFSGLVIVCKFENDRLVPLCTGRDL